MDLQEALDTFDHVKMTKEQIARVNEIKTRAAQALVVIDEIKTNYPTPSRLKALSKTYLELSVMLAIKAVSREVEVDD